MLVSNDAYSDLSQDLAAAVHLEPIFEDRAATAEGDHFCGGRQ